MPIAPIRSLPTVGTTASGEGLFWPAAPPAVRVYTPQVRLGQTRDPYPFVTPHPYAREACVVRPPDPRTAPRCPSPASCSHRRARAGGWRRSLQAPAPHGARDRGPPAPTRHLTMGAGTGPGSQFRPPQPGSLTHATRPARGSNVHLPPKDALTPKSSIWGTDPSWVRASMLAEESARWPAAQLLRGAHVANNSVLADYWPQAQA